MRRLSALSLLGVASVLACGPARPAQRADGSHVGPESRGEQHADDAEIDPAARARTEAAQREYATHKWLEDAEAACAATLDDSHCAATPEGTAAPDKAACGQSCKRGIEQGGQAVLEAAHRACLDRFVAGDRAAACKVVPPPRAKIAAAKVAEITERCTRECRADGPSETTNRREAVEEEKTAEARILAYKKCMVAADSSPPARKADADDKSAYRGLLTKADARCRAASGCERLEKRTDRKCEYNGMAF